VTSPELTLANKIKYGRKEALEIAHKATDILVGKGKKAAHLQTGATDDEIAKVILGPTGNLRAPAILVGSTLVVGFHTEIYDQVFSE